MVPPDEAAQFKNELKCSFCGKNQEQVCKLIAGPGVLICDECVDLCNEIIGEEFPKSDKAKNFVMQLGLGPRPENPHPLGEFSKEEIEAFCKTMGTFVEAYERQKRLPASEPFLRSLLILKEQELGSDSTELMPILEKLVDIYESRRAWELGVDAISWLSEIARAQKDNDDQIRDILIRMARMNLKAGNTAEAETLLAKVAEILKK